jgi:hypothetical protein
MNILTNDNDPGWFAIYLGQSKEVSRRVTYHQGHYLTTQKPSLHYFNWKLPGVKSTFVLLGHIAPEVSETEILLNIGEQLLGTVFHVFPEKMLPEYLPEGASIRQPHKGLMIARAISQGLLRGGQEDAWMLWKSSNPIALRYANEYYKESLDKGRQMYEALEALKYDPTDFLSESSGR